MMRALAMEARGLDIWGLWPIVSAVILGNAMSVAFFFAVVKCIHLQKQGVKDDELPWWVYVGWIVAPITMSIGIALLN